MNWGVKIVFVYVAFVVLILSMVFMAMRQKVDLVAKDYYAQELQYQSKIDGMNNFNNVDYSISVHSNNSGNISIVYPSEMVGKNIEGNITFYRPSDSGMDFKVKINTSDSIQKFQSTNLKRGLYKLKFEFTLDSKPFFTEQNLFIN